MTKWLIIAVMAAGFAVISWFGLVKTPMASDPQSQLKTDLVTMSQGELQLTEEGQVVTRLGYVKGQGLDKFYVFNPGLGLDGKLYLSLADTELAKGIEQQETEFRTRYPVQGGDPWVEKTVRHDTGYAKLTARHKKSGTTMIYDSERRILTVTSPNGQWSEGGLLRAQISPSGNLIAAMRREIGSLDKLVVFDLKGRELDLSFTQKQPTNVQWIPIGADVLTYQEYGTAPSKSMLVTFTDNNELTVSQHGPIEAFLE